LARPRLSDENVHIRSFRVVDSVWDKLKLIADARRVSISEVGRIALEQYVTLNAPKLEDVQVLPTWEYWGEWYDQHVKPIHGNVPLAGVCDICDVNARKGFKGEYRDGA